MTLGDLIKEYRSDHKLSMDEFAQRSGLSKAYVSILERNVNPSTGKPAVPSLETIKGVSSAMGIDVNDLVSALDGDQIISLVPSKADTDLDNIPPGFIPLPKTYKVPLVGRIACGTPITAEENLEGYIDVPVDRQVDFALLCEGDSMVDAGIKNGDAVYIRKQPTVENGQIAAVRINGEATLKRVYINGNTMVLQPANASYPPLTYSLSDLEDVAIEGFAVGFTHWF